MYVTFDSDVGLADKLINAEVIHFGFGSPNENGPLFMARPKFHRGPYMDQLLYRVFNTCIITHWSYRNKYESHNNYVNIGYIIFLLTMKYYGVDDYYDQII